MKTKNRFGRVMFVCAIILLVLACNLPGGQASPPPTIIPVIVTATQPLPAQSGVLSEMPTLTPESPGPGPNVNVSGGGTATPTSSPTPTPTPTLPDFDPIVDFGGGGGGDMDPCAYAGYQPALYGDSSYGTWRERGILCVWGAGFGLPFSLRLISPDGRITLTGNFSVDQRTWKFDWQGHFQDEFQAFAAWTDNGTRIDIYILWPFDLPTGNWQMIGSGDGLNARGNLNVEEVQPKLPSILAYDARHTSEILPVDNAARHSVQPNPDGSINVMGKNFPGRTTVYILLYEEITPPQGHGPQAGSLIHKQGVITDTSGHLESKIPVSLDASKKYLLIGVDANTPLMKDGLLNLVGIATDTFYIKGSTLSTSKINASSCPGAPAQRMTVNQRGYVCTKEDAVKLRTAPSRSGNEIMQLAPGASFEVIDGPSCADNWSWWKIRLDNGTTGWISEGGDEIDPYFICP